MKTKLKSTMEWDGHTITMEWVKTDNISEYTPITQFYGICFNDNKEILVIREPNKKWQLPGGTPEQDESPEETIKRELIEEADISVKDIVPLGVQKVEFPNNPNKNEGELYFQSRYVCKVDSVLDQTVDPDTGLMWERKFVPQEEIGDYIKWGDLGKVMFDDAIELAKKKLYNH